MPIRYGMNIGEGRRTIPNFPSRPYPEINSTTHMFVEDVKIGIIPYHSRRQNGERGETYNVELSGSDQDRERAKTILRALAQSDHRDLEDTVRLVVESLASQLAWAGRAVYEIVDGNQSSEKMLLLVSPYRLVSLCGWSAQLVPKNDWKHLKKALVLLPPNALWSISMPSALGGAWGHKRLLCKLNRYGNVGPNFYMDSLEDQDGSHAFSAKEYWRESEIYWRRLTKRWGWGRRDYSDAYTMEFYRLYKRLTFKWAQATLREHVIAEVNGLLKRLDIEASITLTGLICPDAIMKCRDELTSGHISFEQAYNLI